MASPPALHPAFLPPGTLVGAWRVVAWAGRGGHGTVYRAVPADKAHAPPVALKVALWAGDPRMAREAELLSRLRHPSIPRLWDHGQWQHPFGSLYPFVVMEWIEGAPLYQGAHPSSLSSQEVLRRLAQLASALHALHAHGAVHRDVKGDNVLVRRSDGRALLTDLGTCHYPDATALTPPAVLLGTHAYRSPEAALFELLAETNPKARYGSGPADDLYALGVTGCRWVTGEYPHFAGHWNEHGTWHMDSVVAPASLHSVEPALRDSILRLLSVCPEDRGTAAQWAEELERAASHTSPKTVTRSSAAPVRSQTPVRPWLLPLASTAVALVLGTWAVWALAGHFMRRPSAAANEAARVDAPDAGTAGLGEDVASSTMDAPEPSLSEALAEEAPPEPRPGQDRPDAKGRCPRKGQVALNGGCWARFSLEREACEATGGSIFKGACYLPIIPPMRSPTSTPENPQRAAPR